MMPARGQSPRALRRARRAACNAFAIAAMALSFAISARAQVPALDPGSGAPDRVVERAEWLVLEPLSLEDLLRRVAGITVQRRGGLGSLELVNVAGSVGGRVLLVLDGVEINEPELAWTRLYSVPVSMIERIDLYRKSDPARIEVWTRESQSGAPAVDFDLGRGGFVTRTRRVQLFTPRRAVDVAVSYEELLRDDQDFRSQRRTEALPDLGAYDGRSLLVRFVLRRPDDEFLRVQHQRLDDNSHGSVQSQFDVESDRTVSNELRWQRQLGAARCVLDVGQVAWDRHRQVIGVPQHVSEARTHAGLDVGIPAGGGWRTWTRLRVGEVSADGRIDSLLVRHVHRRYDAALQAERTGTLAWSATAGAHRHTAYGDSWSGRLRVAFGRAAWQVAAEAGRGLRFAGWNEPRVAGSARIRAGSDASLSLAHRGESMRLELAPFAKRFRGGSGGGTGFFADSKLGPTEVAGALVAAAWQGKRGSWRARLSGDLAWTPRVRGARAGMPETDAHVLASLSRRAFEGDLEATLLADWALASRRALDGSSLAPYAVGDVTLNLFLLQRGEIFYSVRNVTGAKWETSPGVLMPGRYTFLGGRLRLLD